jgi:hypothetical protein
MRNVLVMVAALAAAGVAGCQCAGGPGADCSGADCRDGLICDPGTRTCVKPGGGTDAAKGTDATSPGTDAVAPGTDAVAPGMDAVAPGTDAVAPGADAAPPPGTDAAPGTCGVPPTPSDPISCYQTCSSDTDCDWVDADCCCSCAMGGSSVAINVAYTMEWAARQAAMCGSCVGIACASVYLCPPSPPSCGAGGYCM